MKFRYALLSILLSSSLAIAEDFTSGISNCNNCSHQEFLEMQNLLGQQTHDIGLENSALDRLALITGSNSPKYRLMVIRSRIRSGVDNRKAIEDLITNLCTDLPDSFACEQAQAIYTITSSDMHLKLQPFFMYETNSNYAKAVEEIETIFGGAPIEEGLRYRYFIMLGNIEGREQEAINGLAAMGKVDPDNFYLAKTTKTHITKFSANKLANKAFNIIHNPLKVKLAQEKLEQAIAMDPSNPDVPYWHERLNESRYFSKVDEGDEFYALQKYPLAIKKYKSAITLLNTSPYAYIGLARCALATDRIDEFNIYKHQVLQYAKTESNEEALRIKKLMQSMEADVIMLKADMLEQKGKLSQSMELRQKALSYDKDNPWIYYALASSYRDLGEASKGLKLFTDLPKSKLQLVEYAYPYSLYLKSLNKFKEALVVLKPYLSSSDPDIQNELKNLVQINKQAELEEKATIAENEGDLANAITYREAILKLETTEDPWQYYNLAADLANLGDTESAINVFIKLPDEKLKTAEYTYPYALILAKCDDYALALSVTDPYKDNSDFIDLRENLKNQEINTKVTNLLNKGQTAQAIDTLKTSTSIAAKERLANIYFSNNEFDKAKEQYESLIADQITTDPAIYLRLARCEKELNNNQASLYNLNMYKEHKQTELSITEARDLAQLYEDLGEKQQAQKVYETQKVAIAKADNREAAWFLRNSMRNSMQLNQSNERQLLEAKQAMSLADNNINYSNNEAFTKALLTPNTEEDWLHKSIRTMSSELYQKQMYIFTAGFSYLKDSGSSGYSDMSGKNYIANLSFPMLGGKFQVQTDTISRNVGELTGEPWTDMYGTCFATGCTTQNKHTLTKTSIAIAWSNDIYSFDIAALPHINKDGNDFEWKTNDIMGSIAYSFALAEYNLQLRAYRKALDNSFLSYFGDYDPQTRTAFGAVRAMGVRLSTSHAISITDGLWGNISAEKITGKNIKDNSDIRLMGGYYNHFYDQPNEQLSYGVSSTYWHFTHDLSGYTLGQGGYYSPQQFISASLSLSWKKRTTNWSWELNGSLGETWSQTKAMARYPNKSLIPNYLTLSDIDSSSDTDSSWSFGGSITGIIERRVTDNLTVGGEFSITQSEDYSPNQGLVYLRYSFMPWLGDLPMPPTPPTPYTQW